MWDLPRSGIEPLSLALESRFLSTVPPGSPLTSLSVKVKNNSVWSRDGPAGYPELPMMYWAAAVSQPYSGVALKDTVHGNTRRARALSIRPSSSLYMAEEALG